MNDQFTENFGYDFFYNECVRDNKEAAFRISIDSRTLFPEDEADSQAINDLSTELNRSFQPFAATELSNIYKLFNDAHLENIQVRHVKDLIKRLRVELNDGQTSTFQLLNFLSAKEDFAKIIFEREILNSLNFEGFEKASEKLKSEISQLIFNLIKNNENQESLKARPIFYDRFFQYLYNYFMSPNFFNSIYIETHISLVAFFIEDSRIDDQTILSLFSKFALFLNHTNPSVISKSLYGISFCIKWHFDLIIYQKEFTDDKLLFFDRLKYLADQKNEEISDSLCVFFQLLLEERKNDLPSVTKSKLSEHLPPIIKQYLENDQINRKSVISLFSDFLKRFRDLQVEDAQQTITNLMASFIIQYPNCSFQEKKEAFELYKKLDLNRISPNFFSTGISRNLIPVLNESLTLARGEADLLDNTDVINYIEQLQQSFLSESENQQ